MTDVDEFSPIDGVWIPDLPLYLVLDPTRGDELRNTSPMEALAAFRSAGRTPLTVNEGISWLLQQPSALAPGACFMTIGSRKATASMPGSQRSGSVGAPAATAQCAVTHQSGPSD